MAYQATPINQPSHKSGARREDYQGRPLRQLQPRTASDATGINVNDRAPIHPAMPQMPPA